MFVMSEPWNVYRQQGWSKNEAKCAAGRRDGRAGLLKPFGIQMISSQDPDAGHRDVGFGIALLDLSCFGPFFPCYAYHIATV